MYGCLLYPLNYEEYQKKEAETDEKLCKFSEEMGEYDENEEYLLLDEAYVVKLDVDFFEPDTAMETEYFLVLIGDVRFDQDGLCNVIYGWSEEYAEFVKLKAKDRDALDKEELFKCYQLSTRFGFIEAADLEEEFQEIMEGAESEFGQIIKQIF